MHLRLSNAPFHCHSFFHRINLHVPLSQCKSTPVDPRIPRPVITVHVNIFNLIKLSFLSCPMHLFIYLNEFGLDRCTQKGVVEHAYDCSHFCHFLLPLISWQSRKVPVFTTAGQSPEPWQGPGFHDCWTKSRALANNKGLGFHDCWTKTRFETLGWISWQSRKVPVFTTAGQSPKRARSAQGNSRQRSNRVFLFLNEFYTVRLSMHLRGHCHLSRCFKTEHRPLLFHGPGGHFCHSNFKSMGHFSVLRS